MLKNAMREGAQDERPFISVMILYYNYSHLLKRALDACAAQTFRDFEIVMINNGSTDITEDVYKGFCKTHQDISTLYVDESTFYITANIKVGLRKGEDISGRKKDRLVKVGLD